MALDKNASFNVKNGFKQNIHNSSKSRKNSDVITGPIKKKIPPVVEV